MLTLDFVTIFPKLFRAVLSEGVFRMAEEKGLVHHTVIDVRDFTEDAHRTVDDYPYGGGPGMVMKAGPITHALERALEAREQPVDILCPSPQGELFSQSEAEALTGRQHIILLCGHYKAIDERVFELFPIRELSLGDYVLSGGELPSLVIADAVVRRVPGVLGDEDSAMGDSFTSGLLDCGYFTRPETFQGIPVPDVLLSGNHERIRQWRRKDALRRTYLKRPDLLDLEELTKEDAGLLKEVIKENNTEP
jgi:tRNA (guanine37-N1)-methyltransferase